MHDGKKGGMEGRKEGREGGRDCMYIYKHIHIHVCSDLLSMLCTTLSHNKHMLFCPTIVENVPLEALLLVTTNLFCATTKDLHVSDGPVKG